MADEIKQFPLPVDLLEAVLDHLPVGAILLDDDGIIRRFNRYEEQLSGLSRTKTIGKSFFSDVAPCTKDIELGPRFREGIEKNNLDIDVEFSFPYPYNKVPRDVHIRAVSVGCPEKTAHIVLIEDITSRRQLQRNNADMMMGLKSMIAQQQNRANKTNTQTRAIKEGKAYEQEALVLYADVSGFADVASRTAPAELFQVVDRQLQSAIETISRRGGDVDQISGNGLLAIFPLSRDGERTFHDAIRAASEIVNDSQSSLSLPFRIGIALGSVYNGPIGHRELGTRTTVGAPLHLAQALSQVGRPEEIIITEAVVERLQDSAKTSPLRGVSPVGVPNPGTLYRLEEINLPKHG